MTQSVFNPAFSTYMIHLTPCLPCGVELTETPKSALTVTALLLCVCLGTCWLNCGCLSVTQATSALSRHTHTLHGHTLKPYTL